MIRLSLVALALTLTLAGCGEEAAPDPGLDALQVAKQTFSPPADGRLTEDLVFRYHTVYETQRERLIEEGNQDALGPPPADARGKKRHAKLSGTALTRTQMELGVPDSELRWVKQRLHKLGRLQRADADLNEADAAEVAVVVDTLGEDFAEEIR